MEKVYQITEKCYVRGECNLFITKGIFTNEEEAENILIKLENDRDNELNELLANDYEYGDDDAKDWKINTLEGTSYDIKEIIINQLNN
jgi:hypothetical protein